jgi:hypothetical protein
MENTSKSKLQIFVSHVAPDRPKARRIAELLSRRAGASVFTDDMISAGGDWQTQLKDRLREADLFVILLSNDALDSSLVMQELGAAWGLNLPIVCVATDQIDATAAIDVAPNVLATPDDFDNPAFINHLLEQFSGEAQPDAA